VADTEEELAIQQLRGAHAAILETGGYDKTNAIADALWRATPDDAPVAHVLVAAMIVAANAAQMMGINRAAVATMMTQMFEQVSEAAMKDAVEKGEIVIGDGADA
jgi:hypothetical protein